MMIPSRQLCRVAHTAWMRTMLQTVIQAILEATHMPKRTGSLGRALNEFRKLGE